MAKSGINKAILVGNLGQDPEVRYMPNGSAVTNISLATSESWKNKETGQKEERSEWHKVCFFGKLAEIAGEYLRKGSKCYIEGSLRTRKWQDNEGNDRYTTEIIASEMQMLDSRGDNASSSAPQRAPQQAPAPTPQPPAPEYEMTPKAEGYTRDQYIEMGWTDKQLIDGGYMLESNIPF